MNDADRCGKHDDILSTSSLQFIHMGNHRGYFICDGNHYNTRQFYFENHDFFYYLPRSFLFTKYFFIRPYDLRDTEQNNISDKL